jgi:hypothetical protein
MDLTDPDTTFFRELKATKMFHYTEFLVRYLQYVFTTELLCSKN